MRKGGIGGAYDVSEVLFTFGFDSFVKDLGSLFSACKLVSIPIIRLDRPKRLGVVSDRIGRQKDLQSKLDFYLNLSYPAFAQDSGPLQVKSQQTSSGE